MPAPAGAKPRRLGEDLAQTNYGGLAGQVVPDSLAAVRIDSAPKVPNQ